jgi:cation:H+ antiporter
MLSLLLVVLGVAVLVAAGEATLRGSIGLSKQLGLSPALTGILVVGFGTSMPELVVGLHAALEGRPGFAVGNVLGANIANSLLILGTAALIRPLRCEPRSLRRDGGTMLVATLLCVVLGAAGGIAAWQGAAMLILLVGYVLWSYQQDRKWAGLQSELHGRQAEHIGRVPSHPVLVVMTTVGGLAGLLIGAGLLVDGAAAIGRKAGIPDSILGLTLFAIGTTSPEMFATVIATRRGHTDVAIGNIVGSNVFNILGILGAAALVAPLPFPADVRHFDIWILLASTAVLFPILITDWRISRREGTVLLACYGSYLASLAWRMIRYGGSGTP